MALTKSARKAPGSESTSWQHRTATGTSAASGTSRGTGRGAAESTGTTSVPQFGSMLVRVDSLTPYSDATNCRHSKRKSATGSGRSSCSSVRRPMNAFMVWSQLERRQISAADPTLHNAEISRRLGARWRRLTASERLPYIEEADRLRVMHAVEFPGYKYTPRKSRTTRTTTSVSSRRQTSQRSVGSRRSTVNDLAPLPAADPFDSEVSLYFSRSGGAGSGTSTMASSGRQSSKRRSVGRRRTATESSGETSGRNLPPTPDSSAHCLLDLGQMFRVIDGGADSNDVPRAAAAPKRARKRTAKATTTTTTSRRFDFPAVALPSDVQLGGVWNAARTPSDDEDGSNDVGALDTPISLEQDALVGCSLFNLDDRRADVVPSLTGASDLTTGWNDIGEQFCVDYCTPEVAAIVRDDWLEETIHNDALI